MLWAVPLPGILCYCHLLWTFPTTLGIRLAGKGTWARPSYSRQCSPIDLYLVGFRHSVFCQTSTRGHYDGAQLSPLPLGAPRSPGAASARRLHSGAEGAGSLRRKRLVSSFQRLAAARGRPGSGGAHGVSAPSKSRRLGKVPRELASPSLRVRARGGRASSPDSERRISWPRRRRKLKLFLSADSPRRGLSVPRPPPPRNTCQRWLLHRDAPRRKPELPVRPSPAPGASVAASSRRFTSRNVMLVGRGLDALSPGPRLRRIGAGLSSGLGGGEPGRSESAGPRRPWRGRKRPSSRPRAPEDADPGVPEHRLRGRAGCSRAAHKAACRAAAVRSAEALCRSSESQTLRARRQTAGRSPLQLFPGDQPRSMLRAHRRRSGPWRGTRGWGWGWARAGAAAGAHGLRPLGTWWSPSTPPLQPTSPDLEGPGASLTRRGGKSGLEHPGTAVQGSRPARAAPGSPQKTGNSSQGST